MILKFKTTILYVAVFGLGALAMWFAPHMLNGSHNYAEQMKAHHGSSEEGQVNHSHDEVNMPGLQGKDTTESEVQCGSSVVQWRSVVQCRVVWCGVVARQSLVSFMGHR